MITDKKKLMSHLALYFALSMLFFISMGSVGNKNLFSKLSWAAVVFFLLWAIIWHYFEKTLHHIIITEYLLVGLLGYLTFQIFLLI